jgi:hypothetical protein
MHQKGDTHVDTKADLTDEATGGQVVPDAHVPGPWQVRDGLHGHPGSIYVERHDITICRMHEWDNPAWQTANARLMASAPELLAALKALTADIDECPIDGCGTPSMAVWEQVKAAIAKAEGRQP